jgi:hypothetical protein
VFSEQAFVRRLAPLVPRPYHHAVRYFGVLASASPLRSAVVPAAPIEMHLHGSTTTSAIEPASIGSLKRRATWAQLLRKVYDLDVLACPRPGCTGRLRVIAAITEAETTRRILGHADLDDDPWKWSKDHEPEPTPQRPRGRPMEMFPD